MRGPAASLALLAAMAGALGAADAARAVTITEFSSGITQSSRPFGITAGPDGNLWFAEETGPGVARITPQGVVTEFSNGITAGARPIGMAAGPDGNLWFTENSGDRIGRITPQGVVTEFSAGITAGARPIAIAAGPDGNLWFTENSGQRIGRITPQGVVTEFSAGISPGSGPFWITAGPDGNMWFTEANGDAIGRITPQGVVTEFSAGITSGGFPTEIAAGPDGNLWFSEYFGDRIGRITPQGVITEFSAGITPDSGPRGIAAGPDGNMWFTEFDGDQVGRITPQGVITEFSEGISQGSSAPIGMTLGPDGNLWFTEYGDKVARITLDTPVGPDTTPPETTIVAGPAGDTSDSTPTFSFVSNEASSTFQCLVDIGPFIPCASPFTTSPLGLGAHNFDVRAIDVAGNVDPTPARQALSVVAADSPQVALGETLVVRELSGRVLIALQTATARGGARASQKGLRFVPLEEVREIPVGSFLDTRRGTVRITSARDAAGRTQSGDFGRGLFQVLQSRRRSARGLTELRLKGSSFRRCGARGRAGAAQLSRRTIRRLRSNATGRFRTRGRNSAATVRGTVWETIDRCDGTLTKVTRGRVVVRDFRRRTNVTVRAGKRTKAPGGGRGSYLARAG